MTKWIFSVLLVCVCANVVLGQTKVELEQRRAALLKQIEQNKKVLSQTEQKSDQLLEQANAIGIQIALRQEVLSTMIQEISLLTESVNVTKRKLNDLNTSRDDLLQQHAKQIRQAYIERKLENPVAFIFSSSNLNEAFARWQYLEAVSRSRKQTLNKIVAQTDSIATGLAKLESLRQSKQSLAEGTVEQERALVAEKRSADSSLSKFRKKESELKKQIDLQMRESEKLDREIERVISSEVAKNTTASTLPNAPELAALTSEFSGNKGKLPWPVDQGVISGKFGDQPHPVIKSIKISNNGIDITAPPGENVHSVFAGEVVGKKVIPGFDYMLIIRHGSFYSVYSRLVKTNVEIGDNVKTGQVIGSLEAKNTQNALLHLEIWKNKQKLNPASWISRS